MQIYAITYYAQLYNWYGTEIFTFVGIIVFGKDLNVTGVSERCD